MSRTDDVHGTVSYSYDKRGNIRTESDSDRILRKYLFDARGRLASVKDDEKGTIEYTYDALGYRTGYTANGKQVRELRDHTVVGDNLLQRQEEGISESYFYDGTFCSVRTKSENLYVLHDELGSAMYLTGTYGARSSYSYDDFGKRKTEYRKDKNILYPIAFTGYQEDEISGLAYAQARYYSSDNGRFVQEDICKGMPSIPMTLNPYVYCINDPKIYADKDGAIFHIIAGALAGAVTGAVVAGVHSYLTEGKVDWQAVGGAAIGGAVAGGVTAACPALGPAAIGAISGGATSLATGLIRGESLGQVAVETVVGTATGALGGKIFQGIGSTVGRGVANKLGNVATSSFGKVAAKMTGEAVTSTLGGAVLNTGFNAVSHLISGEKYSLKDAGRDALIGGIDGLAGWATFRTTSAAVNKAATVIEKTGFGKSVNALANKAGARISTAFNKFAGTKVGGALVRMGSAATRALVRLDSTVNTLAAKTYGGIRNFIKICTENAVGNSVKFSDWQSMKEHYDGTVTKYLKENKPKGSPTPKKWFDKGGTIEIIEKNGTTTWKYTNAEGESVNYIDGKIQFSQEQLFEDTNISNIDITEFNGRSADRSAVLEYIKKYGYDDIPEGYIVHHDYQNGKIQLVKEEVHVQFTHYGGVYANK